MTIPSFSSDGNLCEGIHQTTWQEFANHFGFTTKQQQILLGLKAALMELKQANCKIVYIGGSFITNKPEPNGFDGCWDPVSTDLAALERNAPTLLKLTNQEEQKAEYGGVLFPSMDFEEFFQQDREGNPKGIVAIDLNSLSS